MKNKIIIRVFIGIMLAILLVTVSTVVIGIAGPVESSLSAQGEESGG